MKTPKLAIIIAAATGLAAGTLATSGVFLATQDDTTNRDDHVAQCVTAVEHSDTAIALYSDTLTLTADTMEAYERYDYQTMDRNTEGIRDINARLTPLLNEYDTAKTYCLQDQP